MIRTQLICFATLCLALSLAALGPAVHGADSRHRDDRSRIVESSLKDLSNRNDSALGSIRDTPQPAPRAFSGERAELGSNDIATTEELIRDDITSGLHRLRRESASRQTADDRQARVNESLDRQMTEALDRSAARSAAGGSNLDTEPEFSVLVDERLNLRPDDAPENVPTGAIAQSTVKSDLHRLRRNPTTDEEP